MLSFAGQGQQLNPAKLDSLLNGPAANKNLMALGHWLKNVIPLAEYRQGMGWG
ncbi:hypothetical protein [Hymenobacter frigidus]|uniref:hypothetical protein n=1 Tax=Hymenobacter frigidus TaxID=1524095 RepID=UPI001E3743D4|nr:hypothetical protein [Hymenobacter frigidus]